MVKDCVNCKNNGADPSQFPCGNCVDDENGEPIYWGAKPGETVDHPQHYNQGRVECIDVMVDLFGKEATQHFCLLNAFKYIWRTNYKNGVEDIRKAWWYLDKYLELEGAEHE